MNKKLYNIISVSCIFILGILIGTAIRIPIPFSKELNLAECINILVTIILGVYIARIIEKNIQDKRKEKDLFIEGINQLSLYIDELEKIESDVEIKYFSIVSRFSRLRGKKNRILKQIKSRLDNDQIKKIEQIEAVLKDRFTSLKNLLTYTTNLSRDIIIVMNNDNVKFTQNRIQEINVELLDINDALQELKLFVNSL